MKVIIGFFILTVFFSQTQSQAQSTDRGTTSNTGTNAYNAAGQEKSNQTLTGLTGIAGGAAMATYSCPECGPHSPNPMMCMICATSIAGGIESLTTLNNAGSNTDPSRNPLSPDFNYCSIDPASCKSGSTGGEGDLSNSPAFNTAAREAISDLRSVAATQGVNIDDPASVDQYLADHKKEINDTEGQAQAMAMMNPAQLERIEKIKKGVLSKFHVASVGTEAGGGGRLRGSSGDDKLDLSSLFSSAAGGKNDREPGSIAGLQKSLGGEPIGVATDNIFKQVSRRYESKIKTQSFLAPFKK